MWTEEEDRLLAEGQAVFGNRWSEVCKSIPGKNGQQCAQRWRHRVNPEIKKEKWSREEDEALTRLVNQYGNSWAKIARNIPGRTDQQCMGRWKRHLDPTIRRAKWSQEEVMRLCALAAVFHNSWSSISRQMKGRTPQQCRTRYHNLRKLGFVKKMAQEIAKIDVALILQESDEGEEGILREDDDDDYYEDEDEEQDAGEEDIKSIVQVMRKSNKRKQRSSDCALESRTSTERRKRGRPSKSQHDGVGMVRGVQRRRNPAASWRKEQCVAYPAEEFAFLQTAQKSENKKRRSSKSWSYRRLDFKHIIAIWEGLEVKEHQQMHGKVQFMRVREGEENLQPGGDGFIFGSASKMYVSPGIQDHDEGIMLPIDNTLACSSPFTNSNVKHYHASSQHHQAIGQYEAPHSNVAQYHTAVEATPPKPRSKRQIIEYHRNTSPCLRAGFAPDLDMDLVHEVHGSKTPLSALRHAPKGGLCSPALADLLQSPPLSYEFSNSKHGAMQGLISSPANSRPPQFWNASHVTPSRDASRVVRCLDADIEWVSGESYDALNTDYSSQNTSEDFQMNQEGPFASKKYAFNTQLRTPAAVGTGALMVPDSTPAPHSVMMRNRNVDEMYVQRRREDFSHYVSLDDAPQIPGSNCHLVAVGPAIDAVRGGSLQDNSFQTVDLAATKNDMKARSRRLSSAHVRMSLHALLENA